MPILKFETHEIEAIESRVSFANNDLPWKLDPMHCQVTSGDHTLIYCFTLDYGTGVQLKAQSNGGSIDKLYGFALRGEGVKEFVRVSYNNTQFAKNLEANQTPAPSCGECENNDGCQSYHL